MASSSVGDSCKPNDLWWMNRNCYCRKRAAIKISESEKNPNKLYMMYEANQCRFFDWLNSMTDPEPNSSEALCTNATEAQTGNVEDIGLNWKVARIEEELLRIKRLGAVLACVSVSLLVMLVACGL